jgi:uncharacterized membrane protein YphA (DoxX/SURF4 family)
MRPPDTTTDPAARTTMSTAAAVPLALCRILMGGVFLFAAYIKLSDPQSFSESIQAFKIIDDDNLVLFSTYALPWTECFAGICLILGLWTRAAAFIIASLLLIFIAAVASVLLRGMNVSCGCFGRLHLICASKIAWCKVWENSILTAITLVPLVFGAGRWSLDARLGAAGRGPA